LRQD